jgi:Ca-activated chloride channel homolog
MNKVTYTYPTGKLIRKIVLVELALWLVPAIIFVLVRFLDFKKEWVKPYISEEMKEHSKEIASSYFNEHIRFIFLHPGYFWFLLLIPLYLVIDIGFMKWKNAKINRLGNNQAQSLLLPPIRLRALFWKYFWLRNAIVGIVFALVQPVLGEDKVSNTVRNAELIIGLDISNSMNVKDISEVDSRLTIAKRAMIQLINSLRGERIGICVFAGNAYVQLPLTSDYDAAKMYVNEIETDMVSKQGTDLAAALTTSLHMYTKANNAKLLLLVTDGENQEGGIPAAMGELLESKVKLAILGIGTKQGGYVPNDPFKPEFGYKVSETGKKIISKVNPTMIKKIAEQANGYAVISSSSFPNLEQLVNQIHALKSEEKGEVELEIKVNQYQWPLVFAILCFTIYLFFPFFKPVNAKAQ